MALNPAVEKSWSKSSSILFKNMRNILIIDDNQALRQSLNDWLDSTFENISIIQAADGEEGIIKAISCYPDIITMDIRMPGIGGIEAVRQIKNHAPKTKIIVLSLYDDPVFQHDAEEAGADAYILKKQIKNSLLPVLQEMLGPTDQPETNIED